MKYKLLRLSLMACLTMLWGTAFAQDPDETITFSELGYENAQKITEVQGTDVVLTLDKGQSTDPAYYTTGSALRLYNRNTMTVTSTTKTIEKVVFTFSGTNTFGALKNQATSFSTGEYEESGSTGTWTGSTDGFTVTAGGTSGHARIQKMEFYYAAGGQTDTRTATTVNVGEDQTGTVGTFMELPLAVVYDAAGAPIEGATVTWSSSNAQVAAIDGTVLNLLSVGDATITATFAGDDSYKGSKGSFKMTVTAAPIEGTITSLKALQEAVTSTSTSVTIQFTDVFVTAVKGSNAYLADNDGYGVLVYQKDHGLEAGQVLNGTISANLVLYRGQTEITGFSKEGLTITTTELTPTEKTIDAITAANQSTLVTLKGVTFSNGKLTDGTNEITYYDNFSVGSLEEGATYDITGIVIVFNTTLEIAPRTADDIVKTSETIDTRLDLTLSFPQESYEAILGEDFEEPVLTVDPAEYDGMISYKSSDASVATVSYDGLVTLVGPGTVIITAEAMASQTYKEAEASYTLIVNERETPPLPEELANPYTYTFEAKTFEEEGTLTLANAEWTLATDAGYFGYDGTKGQQIGSGSKPASTLTLTTADIPGTITKVVVNTCGASGIDATFSVSVGETAFQYAGEATETTTSAPLTNTATEYAFTGSASGAITLSWTNSSSKAIYVKSIYVEYTTEDTPEPVWAWADIKADFTNQSFFTEADKDVATAGLKMNADGTFTRVAADDVTANAVISGKYHSNEHGIQNFSATVKVEGPVKISFGTCAWGGNVTVKDETGAEVVPTFTTNTGACYHQNKERNIVSAFYKGAATTLTIAGGSYVPYFAVEAVDPADIPNDAKVTFEITGVDCEGVAPAELTVEDGATITIPANTTLYKEGFTLTAWTDGSANYTVGQLLAVSADITLLPVFTQNTVEFADRTAETTLVWQFGESNGAGTLNAQGKTAILVTQATIGNDVIDVKMDIDATNGKINNVGRGDEWAQCNDGTILTIPAYKGTQVSFRSYNDATGTTIGGVEAENKTATYEGTAETLDIVAKGIGYISNVTAVYPVPAADEEKFVDIKADFTNGSFFTANETNITTAGLKMNEDGTFTRVAADDPTANAVITGKYHSDQHGLANFSATVKVLGTVKVSMGSCAWGGDVTVKNAEGQTVATFNTNNGACWSNNKPEENVLFAYYKVNEPTTLTISGGSYTPYFAVEAVSPEQIPNDVKFIFDVANSGAEGVAPADETAAIGKDYTLPKNFTLYKEGFTLTGWTDGQNTYAPDETITAPDVESVTLLPVFTENTVSLADRTEAVTVKFNFRRDAGAPTVAYQNQTGIWVAQATIGDKTIDVKADFDTNNGGKFANGNWTDWAQLNGGTKWTVPSCKGATVSMEAYSDITTTTIDGQSDYTTGKTISYTIAGAAETVNVVIGDGSYYRYIQVVLPVVESQGGGESYENATATIEWPFNDSGTIASYTAQPDGAFSTVAVNTGDLTITGVGTRSADDLASGITFIKLKPAGDTKTVQWVAKPAAGLTFTPTKVSMWIQRFGTDAENGVTITAKVGEDEAVTLGNFTAPRANKSKADDKYGSASNWTNHVEIELTADQQAALTSGEELVLSATVGVGNTKEGGFSDVIIEGLVNGTVANVNKYTLATAVAPEGAGSINVYPVAEQYEEGSEVTLTATENFGYDFVNWINAAGEEVSTEAKFKYTVTSNETLTANFVAVETYELALTVDGTNDYMVTVSPEPTMVDGKMMYEAGQAVQLNANQYEGLVTFTNWSDGETNSSKLISMTEDIQITAMYAQADIIAGWDFYTAGGNGRKADFYAQDNDGDALNLVNTETGETSGWLDKSWLGAGGYESFKGAAVNWRTGSSNGDVGNWHWQTKVNAEAFTDVNVQFQMLYNYNAYQTYDAEYSLDGENWTKFGSITMGGTKQVAQFNELLPAEANNQAELYIRMLADKTSSVDGAASANDGNTLAMFFITGTPKLIDDGVAPVLVSTVPADGAAGVSASGKIVLTFDERVKVAEGTKGYINNTAVNSNTQNPTTPTVSGKTVTFEYKGLEYSTEYQFRMEGNTVADLTDNYLAEPITLTFTTMTRPSVEKKMYDYVVSNVDDLMAAIAAAQARSDKNTRYRVFIKDGEYTIPLSSTMKTVNGYEVPECITFINTDNVSFIGESRDGVIITNGIDKNETFAGTYGTTSKYDGIGNSDVFQLRGQGYYWQDLTVETGMDDATGRDLAIHDRGTKNIYKNVGLRGYQDTWTSNNDNGLYYFEGGYVRGRTDYMCGKGDIFWNGVELRQIAGGYAAVPSKPAKYGWIYKDCVINGEGAYVDAAKSTWRSAESVDGNYTLGRPWGSGTPIALFIDTKMNVVPSAIGWNEMSGGYPARFAEYNSMTSTGSQIDLSGRKKTFGDGHANNPVLTAEEALENSDLHRMYGEWDPTLATEQAPIPTNVTVNADTKVLSWDNSNYALLYAIVKDGKVIDFTIEPKYIVDDITASYAVRAANEMGGLSEASATAVTVATAISEVANGEQAVPETIYNLNGVRVQKAQRGLFIVNGKKVVIK